MSADEPTVGDRLRARGASLAIAESVTGGAITARLTAEPGASDFLRLGVVPYGYDEHRTQLAVSRETLDRHGAVSEAVAAEMAQRVRDLADTTWALSATGIAGPAGGTEDKPVGTGYVGVAHAAEWGTEASYTGAERVEIDGDRAAVIDGIARAAIELLNARLRKHV